MFVLLRQVFSTTPKKWREEHAALLRLENHQLVAVSVGGRRYQLELVNTPASRVQGLGNRDQVKADGMLFVFPRSEYHSFWMRNMNFSLDIIWIHHGCITEFDLGVPAEPQTKLYRPSQQRVEWVWEAPAGFVQSSQLQIGQCLTITPL